MKMESAHRLLQPASDFKKAGGDAITPGYAASDDAGLNVVLMIQVPLKHKAKRTPLSYPMSAPEDGTAKYSVAPSSSRMMEKSDVETAVIGHGETEGPFAELNHRFIERDRFPVRVTAQFFIKRDVKRCRHRCRRTRTPRPNR